LSNPCGHLWRDTWTALSGLLSLPLPREKGSTPSAAEAVPRPYALISNTVELIPTLGALFPRGGPVEDPVLTLPLPSEEGSTPSSGGNLGAKGTQGCKGTRFRVQGCEP